MIVSKATSVYSIMIVVLVSGLWFILAVGSTLVPPTDLAGKWELTGPEGTKDLSIEQSGRFINLAMGKWIASLKIKQDGNQNPAGQRGILMAGSKQTVTFGELAANDTCTIHFDGSITGVYQAHRVARAFH